MENIGGKMSFINSINNNSMITLMVILISFLSFIISLFSIRVTLYDRRKPMIIYNISVEEFDIQRFNEQVFKETFKILKKPNKKDDANRLYEVRIGFWNNWSRTLRKEIFFPKEKLKISIMKDLDFFAIGSPYINCKEKNRKIKNKKSTYEIDASFDFFPPHPIKYSSTNVMCIIVSINVDKEKAIKEFDNLSAYDKYVMRLSKRKIRKMSCEKRMKAIIIKKIKERIHIKGKIIDGFIIDLDTYKFFRRPSQYWVKCGFIIFTETLIYSLLKFYFIPKEYIIGVTVVFIILIFYTIFFSFFLRFAYAFSGNDRYRLGYEIEDFWPWIL